MQSDNINPPSLKALIPFLVFLGLFLGTGIILTYQGVEFAFYQLPASIAIIPAVFVALYLGKETIDKKIGQFIKGAGHENIITMCMIYLLAGAFASVAKATGSVDASVQLGLALFPAYLLLPGLFIVSAFIATAMGTSMGTIAAIAPIALGFVETADVNPALIAGVIISGAIFGDNLSIISDTTIAATRSQGAQMKDKFKTNFKFAVPAAVICLVIFTFLGESIDYQTSSDIQFIGLIPYLLILTLALLGVNVFVVLTVGIITAALIGYISSGYELLAFVSDINSGFSNMQDIFILSLFIGGLSALVKHQGGLAALTRKIEATTRSISKNNNKKAAGVGIGMLAFFTNFFTANNTVSIIVTGDTAKELATDAELTPAQSASLLDIFACISQGLIPYGAQALLLGATMKISPVDVVTYSFYPMVLFIVVLLMYNKATK